MREPTAIPSTTAWLLSAFFAVSYVASVYALPGARLVYKTQQVETGPDAARARAQNELSRNDPSVIKSRLIGVSLATLSAISVVYAVVTKAGSWDWGDIEALDQTRRLLGFSVSNIPIGSWFIAPLLFIGPMYWQFLASELPFQWRWRSSCEVQYAFSDWIEFRNIIAAPITEELVFRSCIVGLMKLAGASRRQMIFLSPLWFAAAHIHHGWDLYNRSGKTRDGLKRAVLTILFQQLYTSIFGWFEVYLLLRTGSILPCIFAHSFCNSYGVPLPMTAARLNPGHETDIYLAYSIGYLAFSFSAEPLTRT